jgi:hypothetical protein
VNVKEGTVLKRNFLVFSSTEPLCTFMCFNSSALFIFYALPSNAFLVSFECRIKNSVQCSFHLTMSCNNLIFVQSQSPPGYAKARTVGLLERQVFYWQERNKHIQLEVTVALTDCDIVTVTVMHALASISLH